MHECEECGQMCACDCDDLLGPQPGDCRCLIEHEECDYEDQVDDELHDTEPESL